MKDAASVISNNLELWTGAIERKSSVGRGRSKKFNLYGIERLRALILDFAVRGKLVPQDPADEPASKSLLRIRNAREQLLRDGRAKKRKPLRHENLTGVEAQLPSNWELAKLADLTTVITDGAHRTPNYRSSGIAFISVKDIDGKTVSFDDCKYISQEEHEAINSRCNPERGDILLCRIGTIGRATVVDTDVPFSLFVSVGLLKFVPVDYYSEYYHLAFSSPLLKEQFETIKVGGSHTNKLNLADLPSLEIPIPPLREQKRIVAKVDELMAMCDALEAETYDAIEAHQLLVEQLLATLTNSQDTEELAQNWRRIEAHFDTLFTTEISVDLLKQTILQLAVMGKLVPQDPDEETASDFLKRIDKEKAKLIAEGKFKKFKPSSPITEEDMPFGLPETWRWTRLAAISHVGTGATPSRARPDYYDPKEVNWVTSGETSQAQIGSTKEMVSRKAVEETNVSVYPPGTLIIAMYGQGKTRGQITELRVSAGTNQACAAVQLVEGTEEHKRYFRYYFESSYNAIRTKSAGGAQPNLNVGKIASSLVPLAPLAEQKRIVAKVDELLALCKTLSAHIADAGNLQKQLADAIVLQARG